MDKKEFLQTIRKEFGNFACHFINQQTKSIWPSSKTYDELTPEELNQVNLRRQRPDELILDVENRLNLPDIKKKVEEKKWNYEIWNTGSRGVHISVRFKNLKELNEELRNRVRRYYINEFQTDDKMSKETQWLALEYASHFKSSNTKYLEEWKDKNNFEGNTVSKEIIDYCLKMEEINKVEKIIDDDKFKDFWKTDPYLKYALENQIVDGGRNDVLFKNLVVGLVRSGLEREKIDAFGQIIVNNCPGKNIGEWNGWVEKALDNELTEFNKFELVQWAEKYNHPVLYKLYDDESIKEILTIKQLWDIIWSNRIARQIVWRDLCFYNLIGTVVDEREEDYRIPVIFSCESGSGKDEGLNLIEEVLAKLDYKISRPASATDRTLIGAPNPLVEEFNIKNGLEEGDEKWDKKGNAIKYKDPIEKGLLYDRNWIAFGESETVFKPSVHNKQLQVILRQAMDKSRHIEKGVGGKMIAFNTNTSFIFATYPIEDAVVKIIHNGLFQRALYFDKTLSEDDDAMILTHITNTRFSNDIKKNYDEKEYINLLVEKLKFMKTWFNENKNNIRYFEDKLGKSNEYVNRKWIDYKNSFFNLPLCDKKILSSIIRRAGNNLHKVAMLYASWNFKILITKTDIDEIFRLFEHCINSIKDILVRQSPLKKQTSVILNILKNESKSTMNVYKEIEDNIGIKSTATINKLLKKMKNIEIITEFNDGKYTMLKLTEKGRDLIEE